MSDIVERLRQYQQVMERLSPLNAAGRPWTLAKDAADEIESLRSRLAQLQTCPSCGLRYTGCEGEDIHARLDEAEALLLEIAGHRPAVAFFAPQLAGVIGTLNRIDAFLAPDSASVVEITHE